MPNRGHQSGLGKKAATSMGSRQWLSSLSFHSQNTGRKLETTDPPATDPLESLTAEQKAAMQKKLDEVAGRARLEGRTVAERDAQKKLDDAEAERLANEAKNKGEWEKLFNAEKARADSLAAIATEREELAGQVNAMLDEQIKDWPEEVKSTDPGKTDVKARREWVAKFGPMAKRLADLAKAPHTEGGTGGGGGSTKKPAGGGGDENPTSSYLKRTTFIPGRE